MLCPRRRSRSPPAPVSTSAHADTNSARCVSPTRAFEAHDRDMRLLACLFLLAACVCPAPAAGGSFVRGPLEDVGIPFWCDWDADWAAGATPNRGILLKLAEEEEDFGVSGPHFLSSSFGKGALRARLVVSYTGPTG